MLKKIENYWNKEPCNINHSRKKFLSKEYFDEIKKKNILLRIIFLNLLILKNIKEKMSLKLGVELAPMQWNLSNTEQIILA